MDLAQHVATHWGDKHDGKTAGLSKHESPGADMLVQAMMARNLSIRVIFFFYNSAYCSKSFPPYIAHMIIFTRFPHFSVCIIENWEEPGYEARSCLPQYSLGRLTLVTCKCENSIVIASSSGPWVIKL